MARRKHKGEGSFADATNNHGFKRMRHISGNPAVQAYNLAPTLRSLADFFACKPLLPPVIVFQR